MQAVCSSLSSQEASTHHWTLYRLESSPHVHPLFIWNPLKYHTPIDDQISQWILQLRYTRRTNTKVHIPYKEERYLWSCLERLRNQVYIFKQEYFKVPKPCGIHDDITCKKVNNSGLRLGCETVTVSFSNDYRHQTNRKVFFTKYMFSVW